MIQTATLEHGPVRGYRFGFSPTRLIRPVPVWCYQLDGLLIDTGQHHCRSAVLRTFASSRIEQLVLTHFHEDHSGNAAALQAVHGCRVLAGPLTAERVGQGFGLLPYERFWFGAVPPCADIEPLPARIDTGRYALQPIYTPGHSDDHHVLLEASQGWLFAGDFYIGKLKLFRKGEDIYQMIDSTRHVLAYDFDTVFCGHNPVLTHGRRAVVAKLQYLETLVDRVLEAHRRGVRGRGLLKAVGLRELWWLRAFTTGDVSADHLVQSILRGEG
ncbi:MBL fold metallo-hydrolase [Spirosoma luteolum]